MDIKVSREELKELKEVFKAAPWIPYKATSINTIYPTGVYTKIVEYKGIKVEQIEYRCMECNQLVYGNYMVNNDLWCEVICEVYLYPLSHELASLYEYIDNYSKTDYEPMRDGEGNTYEWAGENDVSDFLMIRPTSLDSLIAKTKILEKELSEKYQPYRRGKLHLACLSKLVEKHLGRSLGIEDFNERAACNNDIIFWNSLVKGD